MDDSGKAVITHPKNGEADAVIAGALYDFLGYATARENPVTMSKYDAANPVLDLFNDWARLRGLDIRRPYVKGWRYKSLYLAVGAGEPPSTPPEPEATPRANEGPETHADEGQDDYQSPYLTFAAALVCLGMVVALAYAVWSNW